MDQMKGMGVAPHLNPAFLQEMAAQGNAGAKGMQNMVGHQCAFVFHDSDCVMLTLAVTCNVHVHVDVHVALAEFVYYNHVTCMCTVNLEIFAVKIFSLPHMATKIKIAKYFQLRIN